jgi:flagellar FliJ protein
MAEKFKLHAVLKYRKTLEEQAQQRLAELLSVEAGLKQKQEETRHCLEALSAQVLKKHQQGLSILELQLYEDQIEHHRQQQEILQRQLTELGVLVNERRQELLFAARERKIIEKLKEKQLAEYLRKLDRKERVMLDEISLRQNGGFE